MSFIFIISTIGRTIIALRHKNKKDSEISVEQTSAIRKPLSPDGILKSQTQAIGISETQTVDNIQAAAASSSTRPLSENGNSKYQIHGLDSIHSAAPSSAGKTIPSSDPRPLIGAEQSVSSTLPPLSISEIGRIPKLLESAITRDKLPLQPWTSSYDYNLIGKTIHKFGSKTVTLMHKRSCEERHVRQIDFARHLPSVPRANFSNVLALFLLQRVSI